MGVGQVFHFAVENFLFFILNDSSERLNMMGEPGILKMHV
jgi:hypothetical protein